MGRSCDVVEMDRQRRLSPSTPHLPDESTTAVKRQLTAPVSTERLVDGSLLLCVALADATYMQRELPPPRSRLQSSLGQRCRMTLCVTSRPVLNPCVFSIKSLVITEALIRSQLYGELVLVEITKTGDMLQQQTRPGTRTGESLITI